MSDGATDIGKLLDPGLELPSYDPAWETRWDKANTLLRLVRERDPHGSSELAERLAGDLCEALSAQEEQPDAYAVRAQSKSPETAVHVGRRAANSTKDI